MSQPTNQRKRLVVESKHNDAGRICGRMSQNIREVAIEGDQRTALASDYGEKMIVSRSGQILITRERDVVAGSPENGRDAVGHVLVELDSRHH